MFKFITTKINRKLTAMCLLLAALICAATCAGGYYLFRNSSYRTYNSFAYEIGDIALTCVDADRITEYLAPEYYNPETGEFMPDAEYQKMAESIHRIYINTSMNTYNSGIYICIPEKTSEGEYVLINLFDVRIMEVDEETRQYFEPGVVDRMGVDNPEEVMNIFRTGTRSSDYFVHESKFGYNSTAILPVKNSSGETVALLMADMPMPFISQSLQNFWISIVIIIFSVVALFIGVFITIVHKSISKPVRLISNEAASFTDTDIKISEKLSSIKQEDEIGQLAKSILKMETDINSYVDNLTRVTAEKERISVELDVATNIQKSMLPCIYPAFPDRPEMDIYAIMDPAKEVGGDFYDFFMVDESHVAIVAADVSGKGVPAALFMVIAKTLIKDHTAPGRDLGDVFTEVNNLLCESNSEGLFVTAFEAVLDLETGELRFVNAGHETPFISNKRGDFKQYKVKNGFVLAGIEDIRYQSGSYQMEEGDRLFQYTDGVTEATNARNELYGMSRLEHVLNRSRELELEPLLHAVRSDIDDFVGGAPQFDDITMICLEFKQKMQKSEE